MKIKARLFEKIFRTQHIFQVAGIHYNHTFTVPLYFPEKTDIDLRAFGGGSTLTPIDEKAQLQIGRSGIGTISDIYTLACAAPNTNKKALAVLNWIEQR